MASLSQLSLVEKLEQKKEQKCALDYQHAKSHLLANQQKLSGLENYRLEYLRNIRSKAKLGIGAKTLNQHHQFVAQLDKACEQQMKVINQAVLVADQRKKLWLTQQQKYKSIAKLIENKQKELQVVADKHEQKMFDEYVNQQVARKTLSRINIS